MPSTIKQIKIGEYEAQSHQDRASLSPYYNHAQAHPLEGSELSWYQFTLDIDDRASDPMVTIDVVWVKADPKLSTSSSPTLASPDGKTKGKKTVTASQELGSFLLGKLPSSKVDEVYRIMLDANCKNCMEKIRPYIKSAPTPTPTPTPKALQFAGLFYL